jgi:hypothetical protein
MSCSLTPAAAAEVANPDRKEWPEKDPASRWARWAARRITRTTDRSESRAEPTRPDLSTARKTGPSLILETSSQCLSERTGQVSRCEP